MILVVAATTGEIQPFRDVIGPGSAVETLVAGVGPVETTLNLSRFLERNGARVNGVVNIGVAGALPGSGLELLDLCLASREVFADIGICMGEGVEPFGNPDLEPLRQFSVEGSLFKAAEEFLAGEGGAFRCGTFITVCGASGTFRRGEEFVRRHGAICENMEGAAVARVCRDFFLDFVEIRCISNQVEDRDPSRWQLAAACSRCGASVAGLVRRLLP